MNLPITTGALVGAARLAVDVAAKVSHAIGFDEVLRGTASQPPSDDASPDIATATDRVAEAVRSRLRESDIEVNPSLTVSVTEEGQLRVESNHSRAAEIEALLSSDPKVLDAAQRLAEAQGAGEITIDLTPNQPQENILTTAGGYPNW